MNPQRTNPDPGYFPVSDRMAGWLVGGFMVICALVVTLIGVAAMMIF